MQRRGSRRDYRPRRNQLNVHYRKHCFVWRQWSGHFLAIMNKSIERICIIILN